MRTIGIEMLAATLTAASPHGLGRTRKARNPDVKKSLLILLLAIPCLTLAEPRVYSVQPFQTNLATPVSPLDLRVDDVAIDGDSIIATTPTDAYLFRRGADGEWSYSRTLWHVDDNAGIISQVRMKNLIAIIKIGALSTIWEKIGGEWVQAPTAAPITGVGGFAISTNRIMVGANGCNFDAYIYEKNASGIWGVTGRIPADDASCDGNEPRRVDLNYDFAVVGTNKTGVNVTSEVVRTYRKNGTSLLWASAGNITLTGDDAELEPAPDLQLDTLVIGGVLQYRRTSAGWVRVGTVRPLDYVAGTGRGGTAVYRDGVFMVSDFHYTYGGGSQPYVYVKNPQGTFDHVGVLARAGSIIQFDISGDSIVAVSSDGRGYVEEWLNVYKLPADRSRPAAIPNNFDAQDIGDFSFSAGSQYSLAGNFANYLLRQSNLIADTAAILETSEWTDYQSVEADLRINAGATPGSRVGLAVRYLDADNYYCVTVGGGEGLIRLQRKLNGVLTTLAQANYPVVGGSWQNLRLIADEGGIAAYYATGSLRADDTSLQHGRVAALTWGARADFDNLLARSTGGFALLSDELPADRLDRPYTLLGGNWQQDSTTEHHGYRQTDTSGQALAVTGPTLQDQSVAVRVRLDEFATTNPVAWYGVLARYVDPSNFYYLSVRSSNQLQIRKVVNGVITVLKATAYTPVPGEEHTLTLTTIGNELTASLDGAVVARAIDNDLTEGQFGFGTYRASAGFINVDVLQR
jgi:hypothetical protein